MPTAIYSPGAVISDLFKVGQFLGAGAAGEAYEVRLIKPWNGWETNQRFCLKWYKDEIYQKEDKNAVNVRRIRESHIPSIIIHPNVVRVIDTKSLWENEQPQYMLMECLNGISLNEYIHTHSPIPVSRIYSIGEQLSAALKCLHDHDLLHRDVKAANVVVEDSGRVVLLDFGVVKPSGVDTITGSQAFLGTLKFAAPEWLFREECTPSSDIYSLGTILFHMVTGREVFHDIKLFSRLVEEVRNTTPSIPSSSIPAVSYLSHLVSQMLNKTPRFRPGIVFVNDFLVGAAKSRSWIEIRHKYLMALLPKRMTGTKCYSQILDQLYTNSPDEALLDQAIVTRDIETLKSFHPLQDAFTKSISNIQPSDSFLGMQPACRTEWLRLIMESTFDDGDLSDGAQLECFMALGDKLKKSDESLPKEVLAMLSQADEAWHDMWRDIALEHGD